MYIPPFEVLTLLETLSEINNPSVLLPHTLTLSPFTLRSQPQFQVIILLTANPVPPEAVSVLPPA